MEFDNWERAVLRRYDMNGRFQTQGGKNWLCRKRWMQTGSSGTLIGWKSGQTTFVPLWDRMKGAWLWTLCGCKFELANRWPELGHAWTNQGNVSWIFDRSLQSKWRYSKCRHRSCNERQSLAIAMYRTVEFESKKQYFWNSVARLCLPLKTQRRHWVYRHMACGAMS